MKSKSLLLIVLTMLLAVQPAAAASAEAKAMGMGAQPVMHVFDLQSFLEMKKGVSEKNAYDYQKLATALQGIVNREQPQLYYYFQSNAMAAAANVETDKYWLNKLNKPGRYLSGFIKDDTKNFDQLLTLFGEAVQGVVVWDENVPATANVASTIAGAEDLLPVRYDPAPGSAYSELVVNRGMNVVVDLTNKFTGSGTIPDTSLPSTGSAKNDAYLWAKEKYLDTGLTNPLLMVNALDGGSWNFDEEEGTRPYSAKVLSAFIPEQIAAGASAVVSLTVKNTGTATWSFAENYRLGALGSNTLRWTQLPDGGETAGGVSEQRAYFNPADQIGPGETKRFIFQVEAPAAAGEAVFSANIVRDGVSWMAGSGITQSIAIVAADEAAPANMADDPEEVPVNSNSFSYPDLFNNGVPNADYYIARKAFFFDLSPDETSLPRDDRQQPPGTDYNTLLALLAAQNSKAGNQIFTVGGFVPWFLKYTKFADPQASLEPVEAEWKYADIVSKYNAQKDADAFGLTGLSNASVFRHVPLAPSFIQNNDKGHNGKTLEQGKKYVTFYMGDFDAGAWTSSALPILWDDPKRGELPLAWSFVPNTSERVPQVYNYLYETMGPNDYFVAGDNGAGYLNPMMLLAENRPNGLPDFLDVWEDYNIGLFNKFDLDITGFLISGNSLEVPLRVQEAYSRISPAGVGNNAGFEQNIVNGTPFSPVRDMGLQRTDVEQFGKDLAGELSRNRFLNIRVILTKPSDIVGAVNYVKTHYPDINFEVVDPYTYFRLFKEAGATSGSTNQNLTYSAYKAAGGNPVKIDGIADSKEWEDAAEIVISPRASDVLAYGTVWGDFGGESDLKARYRIRWDEEKLYLLEERTDDVVAITETGAKMYLSDATMLFLDLGHRKQGTAYKNGDYAIMMTPGGPDEKPHMFIREGRDEGAVEREYQEGEIAGIIREDGYTMEAAIPWSSLNSLPFKPELDGRIGFSLLSTDNDGPDKWGQIMWAGNGDDQSHWADMIFTEKKQPVDPDPVDPSYPGNPASSPGSEPQSDYQVIDKETLTGRQPGQPLEINLPADKKGVELPAQAGRWLKGGSVLLSRSGAVLSLSGAALEALEAKAKKGELAGSRLQIMMMEQNEARVSSLLKQAAALAHAELQTQSAVIEIGAASGDDEKLKPYPAFDKPWLLTFREEKRTSAGLPVYVYKIAEDGKLTYIPGKRSGQNVAVEVTGPGNYALLSYQRLYDDVPATHWAYTAIQLLAAKQLTGDAESEADQFHMTAPVTRAAFTVQLAKALGLQPVEGSAFSDVESSGKEAGYIAAAQQAGWAIGDPAGRFHPQAIMTREQMAVMAMRTLPDVPLPGSGIHRFKDAAEISPWARKAVDQAARIGLLAGNAARSFAPQNKVTRAESAQVIANLLALEGE